MRDLFSGCAYVRTYVSVTLRNVNLGAQSINLRSHSETQTSLICALYKDVNGRCRSKMSMEEGGGGEGGGGSLICPPCVRLPTRNGLVNEVEFLGLIPQNGGRPMRLRDR